MKVYIGQLILRLAIGVSVIVCLCLVAARAVSAQLNHSLLLVYTTSGNSQNPTQSPMFLVDIERNLFTRLKTGELNGGSNPACSVNGRIAFSAPKDSTPLANADVYVMDISGQSALQVTQEFGRNSFLSWSPDGRHLAFVSNIGENRANLYVVNVHGGAPQAITQGEYMLLPPMWSPDGSQLLFVAGSGRDRAIHTVTLDDLRARPLADNLGGVHSPTWSPDGKSIAFATNITGNSDIYVMDSNGSNLRQLTQEIVNEYFPVWSPDGKSIAFLDYGQNQVHVMDADGKNRRVLAAGLASNQSAPVWSPDGRFIAIASEAWRANVYIYLLNADGSGYKTLVRAGIGYASAAWCP